MSHDKGYRVFVGRLSHRAGERDVERFFKGYGRIREINMKSGFAFIEFDEYRDADDAVHDLNNKDLMGERVTVEHARPTKPSYRSGGGGGGGGGGYHRRDYGGGGGGGGGGRGGGFTFREKYGAPYNTQYSVVVLNLASRAGWQDLKDYMRQVGEVTFTQCHKDRPGEGVVDFASKDDMERAIRKLDGTEFMGKYIKIEQNTARGSGDRRRRSRSRSPRRFSRSPRRSLSRSPKRSRSRSGSRSPARRASHSPSPRPSPKRSPQQSPQRSPSPLVNQTQSID